MSGAAMVEARPGLLHDTRRIVELAWPLFLGQLAVLGFSTVDTVMAARYSPADLAALGIGSAAYITVFISLMAVVLAIGPTVGQLFGARKLAEAGVQLHQAVWLALALSVLGGALLVWPEPFLALSQARPEVADKVRGYLRSLAFALPPALVFTAFRGFNIAVSRPKIVMALQFGALALKVPLNALLVFGVDAATPWGTLHLGGHGAPGCGMATAIAMACQVVVAWIVLRRDPFYRPYGLHAGGIRRPERASLVALARLGVPMGLSVAIEVTGFTFMAFFIARLGATPVAGHQIAVNIVSLMFMMPLSLGNATSTLVAQRIGAQAPDDARRIGWHGLQFALAVAAALGASVYLAREPLLHAYTRDAVIVDAALPLLAWVIVFHIADAGQTLAVFILRAYRLTRMPVLIYAGALWGVGLAGGYTLAFDLTGRAPSALHGARGFWAASSTGLTLAAIALVAFLAWVVRQRAAAAFSSPR